MGSVVQFPSRGRPREVPPLQVRLPRGELSKLFQNGEWHVDWMSEYQDSACILKSYRTEAEADDFIRRWDREHPRPSPLSGDGA